MANRRRLWTFLAAYLLAYLASSILDLGTTALGLQRLGVTEKNVFALDSSGAYVASSAWLLTLGGALVMVACTLFAAKYAGSVKPEWLAHPVRSFSQVYLSPWSRSALEVSPVHTLALVLAFVVLRVAAAANNLLVYAYGWGPMGAAIKWASSMTNPLIGFCLVVFACFIGAMIAAAPFAARILLWWRDGEVANRRPA